MNHLFHLIIFTRFPEAGKTKTRLIAHLGAEQAAQLQKEMTEHTLRQARKTGSALEVRYTGGSPKQMRNWLGDDLDYTDQGKGDLGKRMERAFSEAFKAGAKRVILIGSDCPSNDWKNMENAFLLLAGKECVVGPAGDGGYYLIGLSQPAPQLFRGILWGGNQVFKQTMAAASGLSVATLKPLHDIDFPEDLPPKISVIIPTLNEERRLRRTLEKVNEGFRVETLVVDGGSSDGTSSIALGHLVSRGGRAAQQNLGAATATGELLLFLHADTLLPDRWDWIIRSTLADSSIALGAFLFKIDTPFPGRKFIEKTTNWHSRKGGLPFGDQGFFLRKQTFDTAGGFPDMPIMEDYALARSLRLHGKVVTVPQPATTSGRRWQQHGVLKVTIVNKLMILGYHLGISPHKLAGFYRRKPPLHHGRLQRLKKRCEKNMSLYDESNLNDVHSAGIVLANQNKEQ